MDPFRTKPKCYLEYPLVHQRRLRSHTSCVNALALSPAEAASRSLLASGGDDLEVNIWCCDQYLDEAMQPACKLRGHQQNIFTLAFNCTNQTVYSAGADGLVIKYDVEAERWIRKERLDQHESVPVMRIAADPFSADILYSSSTDTTVRVYDFREQKTILKLRMADEQVCVAPDPIAPSVFLTGGDAGPMCLYDMRKPDRPLKQYSTLLRSADGSRAHTAINHICFSKDGTLFLTASQSFLPTLYSVFQPTPVCVFHGPGFQDYSTMKQFSFAGPGDEYVVAGSDNSLIYIWEIPEAIRLQRVSGRFAEPRASCSKLVDTEFGGLCFVDPETGEGRHFLVQNEPCHVIHGHRGNVNCIRPHPDLPVIFSAGIESLIQVASPYPLPSTEEGAGADGSDSDEEVISYFNFVNALSLGTHLFMDDSDADDQDDAEDSNVIDA